MVDGAAIPPILAAPADAHEIEVVYVPASALDDLPLELLLARTEAAEMLANASPLQDMTGWPMTDPYLIVGDTHVWP